MAFRTNGVQNQNQSILDLVAGSNMTLYAGSNGIVTLSSSGGSTPSGEANLVLATPNGSSGAASLRRLVAADFPALDGGTY